jgi:hypothetical protein
MEGHRINTPGKALQLGFCRIMEFPETSLGRGSEKQILNFELPGSREAVLLVVGSCPPKTT